ncbi:hypothetical protein ACS5PN_19575 [Roseateles sp. NT4]
MLAICTTAGLVLKIAVGLFNLTRASIRFDASLGSVARLVLLTWAAAVALVAACMALSQWLPQDSGNAVLSFYPLFQHIGSVALACWFLVRRSRAKDASDGRIPTRTRVLWALSVAMTPYVILVAASSVRTGGQLPVLAPSSEIELEILGVRPYPDAKFELGYAFAHGFTRVDLNGNTYRQVLPGIVFKSAQEGLAPTYKVVVDQRSTRWLPAAWQGLVSSGTVQLFERNRGVKLASFSMPRDGWPGDQAGAWLAKLLNPDPPGARRRNFDVSSSAQVELVAPNALLEPAERAAAWPRLVGCPQDALQSKRSADYGEAELRIWSWLLLMPRGIFEVHCSQHAVLLLGSLGQTDLQVIGIDPSGTVFARGSVRNDKLRLGYEVHHKKIVAMKDSKEQLVIRLAYFPVTSSAVKPTPAAHEVEFTIPWAAILAPPPTAAPLTPAHPSASP